MSTFKSIWVGSNWDCLTTSLHNKTERHSQSEEITFFFVFFWYRWIITSYNAFAAKDKKEMKTSDPVVNWNEKKKTRMKIVQVFLAVRFLLDLIRHEIYFYSLFPSKRLAGIFSVFYIVIKREQWRRVRRRIEMEKVYVNSTAGSGQAISDSIQLLKIKLKIKLHVLNCWR